MIGSIYRIMENIYIYFISKGGTRCEARLEERKEKGGTYLHVGLRNWRCLILRVRTASGRKRLHVI